MSFLSAPSPNISCINLTIIPKQASPIIVPTKITLLCNWYHLLVVMYLVLVQIITGEWACRSVVFSAGNPTSTIESRIWKSPTVSSMDLIQWFKTCSEITINDLKRSYTLICLYIPSPLTPSHLPSLPSRPTRFPHLTIIRLVKGSREPTGLRIPDRGWAWKGRKVMVWLFGVGDVSDWLPNWLGGTATHVLLLLLLIIIRRRGCACLACLIVFKNLTM